MFFKQFFDKKLAQTSYMVACQKTKEAILIDPKRVLDEYAEVANAEGFDITHIAETHIHADFASGLRDAAKRFNATAYVSDEGDEDWKYENMPENTVYLKDGGVINVGNVELKVIHTPGHTPESISFILTDRGAGSDEPMGIFTGDFLFVGDIGRPDLLEETAQMEGTTEEGAEAMFDSLKKMNQYPEFMQVWPGHGAGSACGKSLGAVPLSTVGYELRNNWVFNYDDKDAFIKELTSDQPEPPSYFAQMKKVNREGLLEFKVKDIEVGTPQEIPGQLFDLRSKEEFKKGFKNGAVNIPYNDKFLQFAGWYIDYDQPMTVIADPKDSRTLQEDLASIGYDKLQLIIPIEKAEQYFDDAYENVSAEEFVSNFEDKNILDVRSVSEYNSGSLENAHHLHFGQLDEKEVPFDRDDTVYVHCQSGVRSAIAMSALKARGYENVVNIKDGYAGITQVMQ
ncbi:MAG TPA: MBL fold metallo-hydrolase [Candidatus Salinicoccus stercoripullorum]|uniref:MBL fold metallo-hydrolase n=1 Tax=Candidatus Salinicoccus stercoripullorum TaxID=2838756 RepID=A0A9D1QIN3_9STAP|nr:MBL fold metallo-hydrolase [Candidatus Salinicoccus stercoripullorum]